MKPAPTVFVSYSHDGEEHLAWALQLATRLRSNGVDAILDRWNLSLGQDLAAFIEREGACLVPTAFYASSPSEVLIEFAGRISTPLLVTVFVLGL